MGQVTKTKSWVDNENVNYTDMNSNFDTIYNEFNGGIDNDNIDNSAAIDPSKISGTAVTLAGSQTLTNKTLTSPKVGTAVLDTNGNEIIKTPATSSAVNEITVTNAATGDAPEIAATGGDTDIHLSLKGKGDGLVKTAVLRQDDTTDSYVTEQVTLTGWGQFDVAFGASTGSDTVTFGVTFASAPIVLVTLAGATLSSVTDLTSFTTQASAIALTLGFHADSISTTGFRVSLKASGNAGATTHYAYTWIAIGTLT